MQQQITIQRNPFKRIKEMDSKRMNPLFSHIWPFVAVCLKHEIYVALIPRKKCRTCLHLKMCSYKQRIFLQLKKNLIYEQPLGIKQSI